MPTRTSTRERVDQFLRQGLTVREMASILNISTQAVYKHVRRIERDAAGSGDGGAS